MDAKRRSADLRRGTCEFVDRGGPHAAKYHGRDLSILGLLAFGPYSEPESAGDWKGPRANDHERSSRGP